MDHGFRIITQTAVHKPRFALSPTLPCGWLPSQNTTSQMRRNKGSMPKSVQYGRHCTGYETALIAVNWAESKSKYVRSPKHHSQPPNSIAAAFPSNSFIGRQSEHQCFQYWDEREGCFAGWCGRRSCVSLRGV